MLEKEEVNNFGDKYCSSALGSEYSRVCKPGFLKVFINQAGVGRSFFYDETVKP